MHMKEMNGAPKTSIYKYAFKRIMWLIVIGMLYNRILEPLVTYSACGRSCTFCTEKRYS